jgi:serine/threonine-protein phosphatase 2A regulatory subunit A
VSSCALFAVAYPRAPVSVRTELLSQFVTLCHDETPMVRRAAAHNLGKLAATMEREYVKTEIMALFTELTQDDQVYLRHRLLSQLATT